MIVVDSSALIAIVEQEHDAESFEDAILDADRVLLGAATKLETMIVAGARRGRSGIASAQALLDRMKIEIAPLTEELADVAVEAFLRFGRARHKAALNFGDCMAYAVAKSLDAPLLYKGNDFAKTDIRAAL